MDSNTSSFTRTRRAAARETRSRRKRIALAVIVTATLLGVVAASAASLGGITSGNLGADTGVVASCDTDGVTLAYTNSYDATLGRYQTTSVSVSGINTACNTKAISLTLKDASNVSLASGSGTVAAGAATLTMSGSGANANVVVGAAVVING